MTSAVIVKWGQCLSHMDQNKETLAKGKLLATIKKVLECYPVNVVMSRVVKGAWLC